LRLAFAERGEVRLRVRGERNSLAGVLFRARKKRAMKIIRKRDVEPKQVKADEEGNPAVGTSIQVLIPEGPNFVMRLFTVKPGGSTPLHSHPWEHEVYIISGRGQVKGGCEADLAAGDAVYVASGDTHNFANTGEDDLRFICVVPKRA
jgi:quercetin dioxygenase-like cupin family protein